MGDGNKDETWIYVEELWRFRDGNWQACGTPWAGKEGMQTNVMMPLSAICFIERGETNTIERVSFMEHYPMLLQQIYRSSDPVAMVKTMELLKNGRDGAAVPIKMYDGQGSSVGGV